MFLSLGMAMLYVGSVVYVVNHEGGPFHSNPSWKGFFNWVTWITVMSDNLFGLDI